MLSVSFRLFIKYLIASSQFSMLARLPETSFIVFSCISELTSPDVKAYKSIESFSFDFTYFSLYW